MAAVQVLEYLDAQGRSPFKEWFDNVGPVAAAQKRWADYKQRKSSR